MQYSYGPFILPGSNESVEFMYMNDITPISISKIVNNTGEPAYIEALNYVKKNQINIKI